tara:strand:+ start:2448 stop:3761 length:1314 start_codon:yes stop_codon:yes gene_type:complete
MIDINKLNHWLNVRKCTIENLNKNLNGKINQRISLDKNRDFDNYTIDQIAKFLDIPVENLISNNQIPSYIFRSKKEITLTKRSINRDGIHFYNYYTLPSPKGFVAPVLIDILCPSKKLPKLNNGHLEPAITISLGEDDINARFDKKLNKYSWTKFKVNKSNNHSWIVGDSYFEPSYCLHTYSRSSDKPGKILSYTTKSNLENLVSEKLNDNSFNKFVNNISNNNINRSILKQEISDKGYDISTISKISKIKIAKINSYFKNKSKLSKAEIKKICKVININPNYFYDVKFNQDPVGKSYLSYEDSIKTIRKFKSYKVASISSSLRYCDLYGYFLKIDNNNKICDILDSNCSHYYVTSGKLKFVSNTDGKLNTKLLDKGDAIWVSSYLEHGFIGKGSLIKISDGQNFNYLEKIDLMNTYNPKLTLERGRKDRVNWGYDN